MKILLASASQHGYLELKDKYPLVPPLQIGYLGSKLEEAGHEVLLLDCILFANCKEAFSLKLLDYYPDVVGISSTTETFPAALDLACLSKTLMPVTPIVLGGVHVTFTAASTLTMNPEVDYVVRGEGERTLLELMECIENGRRPDNVLGVSYRWEDAVFHNAPRPFISDLDILPWPARHLMEMNLYTIPGTLIGGRGCPGRCIFCAAGALSGHRYRHRRPERVVDEIEHLYSKYSVKWLGILDDTFTAKPNSFTLPVCEEIERRELKIAFGCESRLDIISPSLLDALHEAGCLRIQFGIESGSPRVISSLGKQVSLDKARRIAKHAIGLGMYVVYSFILGHPMEAKEDALLTLDLIEELLDLGVHRIGINALVPFPGTEVYEQREAYGVTIHADDWSQYALGIPIISTKYLSQEQLRELLVEANVRIVKKTSGALVGDESREKLEGFTH